MKAKIYVGAKKYALYIGRKIVQKTLEFLTLPARFVSKKVQELKNYLIYGDSKQQLLPDGYTQLEYTRNKVATFIDTGIIPSNNTILKIRYRQTDAKLGSNYIFASRADISSAIYGIGGSATGLKIGSTYSGISIQSDIFRQQNVIYTIEASYVNGNNTLTVIDETNNVTDTKSTTYDWSPQDITFKFYGWNADNCIGIGTDVFEVEIIQDGVSVYHAYPCKQGENVGFYDIVGNTFTSNANLEAGNVAPTPNAPIEIESVGDKTKNLYFGIMGNHNYYSYNTGTLLHSNSYEGTDFIKIKKDTKYVLSVTVPTTSEIQKYWIAITFYNENKNYLRYVSKYVVSNDEISFIPSSDTEYITISFWDKDSEVDINDYQNIQLEEGDTATSYEPYGKYKVPVTVSSKNLFNYEDIEYYSGGSFTKYFENNVVRLNVTNLVTARNVLKLEQGKIYTLTFNVINSTLSSYNIRLYPATNPTMSGGGMFNYTTTGKFSFTFVSAGTEYLRFYCNGTGELYIADLQLEEGNVATDYVPYTSTTTNIYLNEPLRRIGDYADYIDFEGQKVVRNVRSNKLGTDGWVYQEEYTRFYKPFDGLKSFGTRRTPILSECFTKCDDGRDLSKVPNNSVYSGKENNNVYFKTDVYNTVESFANALKDTTIIYPLITPIEEQITLPAINLEQGTLTIDTDTKIKPSKMIIIGDIDNE